MRKIIVFLLVQFYILAINAQVTVDAVIDSTGIFIGQQTGITLQVSADSKASVKFPHYDSLQQIIPGIEVISSSPIDTSKVNDGKRQVLTQKYIITSFDSSLYYIPPMEVKVNGKVYKSNNLALKVYTFDVDTTHVDSIFGLKPNIDINISKSDVKSRIPAMLLFIVFTVILILMIIRLLRNKSIFHKIRNRQRISPHKSALQKIEKIKEENLVYSENSKEYYTQLTDVLRQYLSDRFGVNAMEMTSTEIIGHLKKQGDEESLSELRQLLVTADLVKFAKYTTLNNENDRNLAAVIEYINKTKIEETVNTQPEFIYVEDTNAKISKIITISLIGVFSILTVGSLIYLIYKLYYLFI